MNNQKQISQVNEPDDSFEIQINSDDESESHQFIPSILVADDYPIQLESLKQQVRNIRGPDMKLQECDTAQDGQELVRMYKERLTLSLKSNWEILPYTAIVSDFNMPGCNGLTAVKMIMAAFEQATKKFNSQRISALKPRIIIHSGDSSPQTKVLVERDPHFSFI